VLHLVGNVQHLSILQNPQHMNILNTLYLVLVVPMDLIHPNLYYKIIEYLVFIHHTTYKLYHISSTGSKTKLPFHTMM
jgi:hypothetical protein